MLINNNTINILKMKKYLTTGNIIAAVLLAILCISFYTQSKAKKLHETQLSALTSELSIKENRIGTLTASQQTLQLSNSQLTSLVLSKDDELKTLQKEFSKVKSIAKIETITQIEKVNVPFEVKIPCEFERKGSFKEEYFNFNYTANSSGFTFNNFEIPNKETIITGFKRKWFLGKQTLTTDITHSNPYITTTKINTINVVVPKRFYDTRLFNVGVGFIGGVLLAK